MAEAEFGGSNPFEPDDGWDRFFQMDDFGINNYDYNQDGLITFEDFMILFQMAYNPSIPYYVNAPFYNRMLEKGEQSRIPRPKQFGTPPTNPLAARPGVRSPDGSNPQTGAVRGMSEEMMMGMNKKKNPLFGGGESDQIKKIAQAAAKGNAPQMGGMKPPVGGMPKMGGMKPPAGGMPKMGGGMEQAMGMKPQMPGMGAMGGMQQPAPTPKMPSMSDQPQVKQKLQNLVPFDPNKKKKGMMGMGVEGEAMPKMNNKKLKFDIPGMDDDRGDGNRYDKKGNLKALKRTGIEGEAMGAYQGARAGRQMFKTQARRGY